MSWSIGLNLDNAFAEITAISGSKRFSKRWLIPKTIKLHEALSQFLAEHEIHDVKSWNVATNLATELLKQPEPSMAFLTTQGFEHWLQMSLPAKEEGHFSLSPPKKLSPLQEEFIFGISERILPDGSIQTPLSTEDLEFLVAKLQMNDIKSVAIGFLHASQNPIHEKQATDFLQSKGFQVFPSYLYPSDSDEKSRWWRAIAEATITPSFKAFFEEFKSNLNIGNLHILALEDHSSLSSINGAALALNTSLKKPLLYCGLESLLLFQPITSPHTLWHSSLFPPIALNHMMPENLFPAPTQLLYKSFWGCAALSHEKTSYDPGPLCLGRGVHVTLLDVFFANQNLPSIDGLTEHIKPSTLSRISDNIMAFSKEAQNEGSFSTEEALQWIQESAYEAWFIDLYHPALSHIALAGPLASLVQKAFQQTNIKTHVLPRSEFYLSTAIAQYNPNDAKERQ